HEFPYQSFRQSSVMVFQAIPLMVLMFIVLPRLPSFWNIPLQKNTPKTGMSDSMSPGDFGRLTQSNEAVMRITFNGASPPLKDLYWRGLVLSHFDGRRWESTGSSWEKSGSYLAGVRHDGDKKDFLRKLSALGLKESIDKNAQRLDYEVILEASQNPWLYALKNSIPDTRDIWVTYDHLLMKHGPITQRFKYDAYSYPEFSLLTTLPERQHKMQIALPSDSNSVAKETARRWRQESISDEAYIQRLMNWFHEEFYYTLEPPTLGTHSVDEFLFQTK